MYLYIYTYIPIPVFIYTYTFTTYISSYLLCFLLKRQKWQKCLKSALFLLGCSLSPRKPARYRFSDDREKIVDFVVEFLAMIWKAMVCLGLRRGSTFLADIVKAADYWRAEFNVNQEPSV